MIESTINSIKYKKGAYIKLEDFKQAINEADENVTIYAKEVGTIKIDGKIKTRMVIEIIEE